MIYQAQETVPEVEQELSPVAVPAVVLELVVLVEVFDARLPLLQARAGTVLVPALGLTVRPDDLKDVMQYLG